MTTLLGLEITSAFPPVIESVIPNSDHVENDLLSDGEMLEEVDFYGDDAADGFECEEEGQDPGTPIQ